jgi:hypothetical protein
MDQKICRERDTKFSVIRGLDRVSIIFEKILAQEMDGRIKPGPGSAAHRFASAIARQRRA